MSLVSITASQRYDVGYRLNIAANLTQRFINGVNPITAAQEAELAVPLQNAADALAVAGYGSLPAGQVAVSDGESVGVVNSAGGDSHPATINIDAGALTNVQLTAATTTIVDNADVISVRNSAGADAHPGTAVVAAGVVTGVNITSADTAIVDLNDAVEFRRFDGSVIGTGVTGGTARVASGVLANCRLPNTADAVQNGMSVSVRNSAAADPHTATTVVASNGALTGFNLAATVAMVDNGDALTVPVTGTYTTTATISVANGVVTGIVLS